MIKHSKYISSSNNEEYNVLHFLTIKHFLLSITIIFMISWNICACFIFWSGKEIGKQSKKSTYYTG